MRTKSLLSLFALIFAGLFASCVSVNIPGTKTTHASKVQFTEPNDPFSSISDKNNDKTWLSGTTGNTISYLSDCGNPADPSIEQLSSDSLSVLNDMKVNTSEDLQFNGRAAHRTTASGTVDGVPVELSLLIFKKDGCNYTLTYAGLKKQFASEKHYYESFIESFKAP